MRASLNEIRETEQFLFQQLTPEETLLFEAKLLTNPILRLHTRLQQNIYRAVKAYHRKRLKKELRTIHDKLFSDSTRAAWQRKVTQYFIK